MAGSLSLLGAAPGPHEEGEGGVAVTETERVLREPSEAMGAGMACPTADLRASLLSHLSCQLAYIFTKSHQ